MTTNAPRVTSASDDREADIVLALRRLDLHETMRKEHLSGVYDEIDALRGMGVTWTAIAEVLGISRQNCRQKFSVPSDEATSERLGSPLW